MSVTHSTTNEYGLITFKCNNMSVIGQNHYYNSDEVTYPSGSGYGHYCNTGNHLIVQRFDDFVQLTGRWTVLSTKNASTDPVHFATIPSEYAPSFSVRTLQQGSQRAVYLFQVDGDGKLYWSRYGTTSSANLPGAARKSDGCGNGVWGVVHMTWMLND